MISPDVVSALMPVARALEARRVRYYLTGSIASSYWGKPRLSIDADIVAELQEHHARPLREALEAEYYVDEEMILEAVKARRSFNVVHLATSLKVDVYVSPATEYAEMALSRAAPQPVAAGEKVFVGLPEDILLSKLRWYRLGNEVSDRQWSDILGLLEVRRSEMDRAYLDRWAKALGVADLLDRATNAS